MWCHCYVKLCVVQIIMVRDVIIFHNLCQGEHVDVEEAQEWTLRNSTCNFLIALIHCCQLTQISPYLVNRIWTNWALCQKVLPTSLVCQGESCSPLCQTHHCVPVIPKLKFLLHHYCLGICHLRLKECSLSAVVGPKFRLKSIKHIVLHQERIKLLENSLFINLS